MISSGVINEPPPTPVMPTTRPTKAPEMMYNRKSSNVFLFRIYIKGWQL